MSPEQVAALLAAGKNASEIATLANVHLRTAYKWLKRHASQADLQAPPAATPAPKNWNRAAALSDAIDRAILALDGHDNGALDRLLKLARAAKNLHAIAPPKPPPAAGTEAIHDALIRKLTMMARTPVSPAPASAPATTPAAAPDPAPANTRATNPWFSPPAPPTPQTEAERQGAVVNAFFPSPPAK